MIVLGTVLLNATTARLVAAGLKVLKSVSDGILIVGASGPARIIAQYLHEEGRNVVLIDKNESNVKQCAQMGLQAINADIFTDNLEDNIDLVDMGYLVAMTGSADVNQYAATKYESEFGENGTYRLLTSEEMRNDSIEIPESGLLSYTDDFINLSEVVRDYPHINEIELKDKSQLNDLLEELNTIKESIPILIKQVDGNIEFLPGSLENLEVEEGTKLIYLGKEVELEDEA
jgi:D-arabinose 1-dehydrogenase-like Zn-dependent alcohol dehydrogenase